jgi:5'-3' exonuclease|tara:strand:- start:2563 stop:3246 length:684 start_codon:yes stop_codon:yes gene_type:complete
MIFLIDADTMIFASAVVSETLDEAMSSFDYRYRALMRDIQSSYTPDGVYIFSGSKGNFRKWITPVYKANRKKQALPEHLGDLHDYVKVKYKSIVGVNVETDDMIASYWHRAQLKIGRDNVIIVAIDKDYKQFPCMMYNYSKREMYDISEQEAMYNLYEQMIVGDTADNVNYAKGYGKAYAKKIFVDCSTRWQYTRAVYTLFKSIYKSKAKEKFVECFHLLTLRTDIK